MIVVSAYKPAKWRAAPGLALVRVCAVIIVAVALGHPSAARGFTAEQTDKGREVFRLQCARCHGPDGQGISNIYKGMTAPPLVGQAPFRSIPAPIRRCATFSSAPSATSMNSPPR